MCKRDVAVCNLGSGARYLVSLHCSFDLELNEFPSFW